MKEAILPPPIEGLEGLYDEISQNPLLFATLAWRFTEQQRKAIKKRDGNKCIFESPIDDHHEGYLQIHHILPKSLGEQTGIPVDNPLNGITVCERCHRVLHSPNGHQCAFTTERGAVIWNDNWDDELSAKAVHNTREAIKKGWKFPKG